MSSVLANCLFAVVLLAVAGLLAWHCEKSWRAVRSRELDPPERAFFARRRWRRLAVAAIISLIALAIPLSSVIDTAVLARAYLAGFAVGLLLMFVLALLDLFASREFFARERERFADARDKLEADLKSIRKRHENGNGRSD